MAKTVVSQDRLRCGVALWLEVCVQKGYPHGGQRYAVAVAAAAMATPSPVNSTRAPALSDCPPGHFAGRERALLDADRRTLVAAVVSRRSHQWAPHEESGEGALGLFGRGRPASGGDDNEDEYERRKRGGRPLLPATVAPVLARQAVRRRRGCSPGVLSLMKLVEVRVTEKDLHLECGYTISTCCSQGRSPMKLMGS